MERAAFLDRVRKAVEAASLPPAPSDDPGLLVPALPDVDSVAHFSAALERVDGVVHRHVDPIETVAAIAAQHEVDAFLSWDAGELPVPGMLDALAGRGLRRIDHVVPATPERRLEHQTGYLDTRLGITGAEAGFAETGSIVVRSGAGRPRMASLIPDIHIALLPADAIHRSPAHWAEANSASMADPSNLVFITGPSRTGDIETILTLGVHGPRHLHVILL